MTTGLIKEVSMNGQNIRHIVEKNGANGITMKQSLSSISSLSHLEKGSKKNLMSTFGFVHNDGYVLLITLLMLVALTIAGMGAMMVATSDIQLSGNQRQQTFVNQPPGIDMGMANVCGSYYFQSHPALPPIVLTPAGKNTPTSLPNTGFYAGIYGAPEPTNSSNYNMPYLNVKPIPFPSAPNPFGENWSEQKSGLPGHGGAGGAGGFYRVLSMDIVGNNTRMECEQIVYYGIP